jgi:hypothetical protein
VVVVEVVDVVDVVLVDVDVVVVVDVMDVVGGGVVGGAVVVVVVVVVVVIFVVEGGIMVVVVVGGGGATAQAEVKSVGRYRCGCGQASASMLRALLETDTSTLPEPSRHGSRWAWYVFISGSALRGASARASTVVQGPPGSSATSNSYSSPQ